MRSFLRGTLPTLRIFSLSILLLAHSLRKLSSPSPEMTPIFNKQFKHFVKWHWYENILIIFKYVYAEHYRQFGQFNGIKTAMRILSPIHCLLIICKTVSLHRCSVDYILPRFLLSFFGGDPRPAVILVKFWRNPAQNFLAPHKFCCGQKRLFQIHNKNTNLVT